MEIVCLLLILLTYRTAVTRRDKRTLIGMTALTTFWMLATLLLHPHPALPIPF